MVLKPRLNNLEINRLANQYRQALEKDNLKVNKIILFGSYAKNKNRDWSDVDLLVVSPSFAKKNLFKERVKINLIAKKISPLIEAHPVSDKEYNAPESSWLIEAIKYEVEL